MTEKIYWRVHYVEFERGWGQHWEHRDFETEEEAKAAYDHCNAKLPPRDAAGRAPDYYFQADRIQKIVIRVSQ